MKKPCSSLFLLSFLSIALQGSLKDTMRTPRLAQAFNRCGINTNNAGTWGYTGRYLLTKLGSTGSALASVMTSPPFGVWSGKAKYPVIVKMVRFITLFVMGRSMLQPFSTFNKQLIDHMRPPTSYPRLSTQPISKIGIGAISLCSYLVELAMRNLFLLPAPLVSGAEPLATVLIPNDTKRQKKLITLLKASPMQSPTQSYVIRPLNKTTRETLWGAENEIIAYLEEWYKKLPERQEGGYYQKSSIRDRLGALLNRWWDPLRTYKLTTFYWRFIAPHTYKAAYHNVISQNNEPITPNDELLKQIAHHKRAVKKLLNSLDTQTQKCTGSPTLWREIRKNFQNERTSEPFFYGFKLLKTIFGVKNETLAWLAQSYGGILYSRLGGILTLLPITLPLSTISQSFNLLQSGVNKHMPAALRGTPLSSPLIYSITVALPLIALAGYLGCYRYFIYPFSELANHENSILEIMNALKKTASVHTLINTTVSKNDDSVLKKIKERLTSARSKVAQIQLFLDLTKNKKNEVEKLDEMVKEIELIRKNVNRFTIFC